MASYLRALNLTNGVEEVCKGIEIADDGTKIITEAGITAGGLINGSVGVFVNSSGGDLTLGGVGGDVYFRASSGSTQSLTCSIKNTKATLDAGDILVFDDSDSTFKVDNISNYVSGGGGNTYTISLPFSKGGGNVDGSVTVPTDAIILNYWLKVDSELSTGGAPFQFQLQGSTPLLLAIQDTDFYETVGMSNIYQKTSGCPTLSEASYKVTSADSGVIRAVHSGSGYGGGIFYLEYSTELS
jgi:hypothetical protein